MSTHNNSGFGDGTEPKKAWNQMDTPDTKGNDTKTGDGTQPKA